MTSKVVVHLFHDDADSLTTGSRVAWRMHEVAAQRGVELEVFCFGPAQRHLGAADNDADAVFNRQIDELVAAGVPVGACINAARADGAEDALAARGLALRVARDEFIRFTLDGARILTF